MTLLPYIADMWTTLVSWAALTAAIWATLHAVMTKLDERAAVGWIGVICLVPIAGPLLYWLFGINRIRRRALAAHLPALQPTRRYDMANAPQTPLRRLVDQVVEARLTHGNAIDPLVDGSVAYPAMLAAIDAAQRSVTLCTYIFDRDAVGEAFRAALQRARSRGVQVRVLIDAVGSRYSWPTMARRLRRDGLTVGLFGRTFWPWRMPYANLRNHRKILVVDGRVGFTGGMNLRDHVVHDVHFRIRGPVLEHLWHTLARDWFFTTGEALKGPAWELDLTPSGNTWARGVIEGPDEDLDRLHWVLLGALACAVRSVTVVTPYFLPDQLLLAALNTAAMRGVQVRIVLPRNNNLALVQWASQALLPRVLAFGAEVFFIDGPFDHSKLLLVDDNWALIGSANWDARSIRLNFEFNIECHDAALVAQLHAHVAARLTLGKRVMLEQLMHRPMWQRLRDNVIHLASPYL